MIFQWGVFQVGLSQTGLRDQNNIFSSNGFPSSSQWILETMQPQASSSDFSTDLGSQLTPTSFNQQFSTIPFQQRLLLQFQNSRTQQNGQTFRGQSPQTNLQGSINSPDMMSRRFFAQNQRDWQMFGPPDWNEFSSPFTMQVPNQMDFFQNPFFQPDPFLSNNLGNPFLNDPRMAGSGFGIPNPQENFRGFERENIPRWLANIPRGSDRSPDMNSSVPQDAGTLQDDMNMPGNNSSIDSLSASFERFTRGNQGNGGAFDNMGNNANPSLQWLGNPNEGPPIMPMPMGRMSIDRNPMGNPGRLNILDNMPLFSG